MRSLALIAAIILAILAAAPSSAQDAASVSQDLVSPNAPFADVPSLLRLIANTQTPTLLLVRGDEPDAEAEPTVRIEGDTRFGIGLGGTWYAYGLSGTYDLSETLTAEAILGLFGGLTSVGGRGWYRFNRKEAYDVYAYAGASFYSYRFQGLSESSVGLGGGVGIEASLPQLFDDDDFPPIYVNAEVGIGFASFDTYGYSAFSAGSGIHYRF